MPAMQTKDVMAIVLADIHLSLRPPIARSGEKDWLGVQARTLAQVQTLSDRYMKAPVLCAGDIFHVWNSPPELVNFAMAHLPRSMIAIPGNHDLPLHNYDDLHKSSFFTLVLADRVRMIQGHTTINGIYVRGFPYGSKLKPCKEPVSSRVSLALCHEYCWSSGAGFPGAPAKHNYKALARKLEGFDFAVFGDNHIPFEAKYKDTLVYNCGGLFRRNSDERDHRPSVGLVTPTGIKRHYLDCSADKFLTVEQTAKAEKDGVTLAVSRFLEELASLGDSDVDFQKAIDQYCLKHNIPDDVKNAILESIQ